MGQQTRLLNRYDDKLTARSRDSSAGWLPRRVSRETQPRFKLPRAGYGRALPNAVKETFLSRSRAPSEGATAMAVFIVNYDLNKPGQNYTELIRALSGVGERILKSTWIIDVNQGAKGVRAAILSHLDRGDDVAVIEITPSADWATLARVGNRGVAFLKRLRP